MCKSRISWIYKWKTLKKKKKKEAYKICFNRKKSVLNLVENRFKLFTNEKEISLFSKNKRAIVFFKLKSTNIFLQLCDSNRKIKAFTFNFIDSNSIDFLFKRDILLTRYIIITENYESKFVIYIYIYSFKIFSKFSYTFIDNRTLSKSPIDITCINKTR